LPEFFVRDKELDPPVKPEGDEREEGAVKPEGDERDEGALKPEGDEREEGRSSRRETQVSGRSSRRRRVGGVTLNENQDPLHPTTGPRP